MGEADDAKRVAIAWWVLLVLVTIGGLAIPGRVLPVVVLVIVLAAFGNSFIRARRVLPERVASHFSLALVADGWMGRRAYLVLTAVLAVVLGVITPLVVFLIAEQAGDLKMQRLALWLMPMILALLLGVHEFTVQANQREPATLSPWVWALMGCFFLAINLWGLATLLPW
jgi:hypothetical protein